MARVDVDTIFVRNIRFHRKLIFVLKKKYSDFLFKNRSYFQKNSDVSILIKF